MAECLYYGDKPIGLIQSNADDIEYSTGVSVKDELDRMNKSSIVTGQQTRIDNTSVTFTADSDCYVQIISENPNSLVYIALNGSPIITARAVSTTDWIRNAVFIRKGITFSIVSNNTYADYRIDKIV